MTPDEVRRRDELHRRLRRAMSRISYPIMEQWWRVGYDFRRHEVLTSASPDWWSLGALDPSFIGAALEAGYSVIAPEYSHVIYMKPEEALSLCILLESFKE